MKETDALQVAHGTPADSSRAVWNALGEISVVEATVAIAKYEQEWLEAEACKFVWYGGALWLA